MSARTSPDAKQPDAALSHSEERLRRHPHFESLISELAARFAGLADSDVTGGIAPALAALGEFLAVDRLALWDLDPERREFRLVASWHADGVPQVSRRIPMESVPVIGAYLLRGEIANVSTLESLPADSIDRSFLAAEGMRSLLVFPIRMESSWVATLSLGMVTCERTWTPLLVRRLRLVGEVLGAALARGRRAAAIAEARLELFHASRLSLAGELTAAVAHEIRQPLASISANTSTALRILEGGASNKTDLQEILRDIQTENVRAHQVIARVGTLLRKPQLEHVPLDLNEIVDEVAALIRAVASHCQVQMDLSLDRSLPAVDGDRVHLRQVLLNLILNGIEAMTGTPPPDRRLIIATTRTSDGRVSVGVADGGRGIPADASAYLFDPFFSTSENGTGLGLTIARSIIEAHAGRIWGENRPGTGAIFYFVLPARA